jgi:hypothetical protein
VKDTAIATQKACSQRFRRDELPVSAPYQLGSNTQSVVLHALRASSGEVAIVSCRAKALH